jgi:hypothetical protein
MLSILETSLTQKFESTLQQRFIKEFDDFFKMLNFDLKSKLQTQESLFRQHFMDLEKKLEFLTRKDPDINLQKL